MVSRANVEIVRHYYEILDSALERYWASPDGPISQSPVIEDVLALMSEDRSKISKIDDYTDRARALETAGLDEQSTP